MALKKSLATLALGLTLATGIIGTHSTAPAHASGRGGRGPIVLPTPTPTPGPVVVLPITVPVMSYPAITAYGRYGTAYVSGTGFTPNDVLTVNLWTPANGPIDDQVVFVDANGNFSMSSRMPSGCVTTPVQVEAFDNTIYFANGTSVGADTTVVPGCIS